MIPYMLISFFLNNSVSSFNNNKILIVRLLNDYIISNYLIVEANILLSFFSKYYIYHFLFHVFACWESSSIFVLFYYYSQFIS